MEAWHPSAHHRDHTAPANRKARTRRMCENVTMLRHCANVVEAWHPSAHHRDHTAPAAAAKFDLAKLPGARFTVRIPHAKNLW